MIDFTITSSQRKAAKLAGSLFSFFVMASIAHYTIIELNLIVTEDTQAIMKFIQSNEGLFRAGIVLDLVLFLSGSALAVALYIVLRPVNQIIALLALLWMFIQTTLALAIELSSFAVLLIVNGRSYLSALDAGQLQAFTGIIYGSPG